MALFNHDWFHGSSLRQQVDAAKVRCACEHFPDLDPAAAEQDADFAKFRSELEVRTLLYLRDGFSYEIKEVVDLESKSHLVFECVPVDEHYKVGSFVVTVPYDEIVRVEVFAVHADEKPEDLPQITGFRTHPEAPPPPPVPPPR